MFNEIGWFLPASPRRHSIFLFKLFSSLDSRWQLSSWAAEVRHGAAYLQTQSMRFFPTKELPPTVLGNDLAKGIQ
jgi:hypothetical protein